MTYPSGSSGGSAYQPGSYGAPAPSYAPSADPGPSKMPFYLNVAVVVLGLAAYVFTFGTLFVARANMGPVTAIGPVPYENRVLLTLAAVAAALLAAIGLLPKVTHRPALVAFLAVLGALVVVQQIVNGPVVATQVGQFLTVSPAWALWVVLAMVVLQAIAAVLVLLYDTGVLTPPAPKPRYENQYQYGQWGGQYGAAGGGYYSQGPGAPAAPGGLQPGPRPGYPSQYAGGYQQGSSTGGFAAPGPQSSGQHGSPTPPTGYPTFTPPPAVSSGQHHAPTDPNLGSLVQPQSSDPSPGSSGSTGSSTS